jgi:RNA polymerase sigma factor (sigma-70 family)
MATDTIPNQDNSSPDPALAGLVAGYLAGAPEAANNLATRLTDHARFVVQSFLRSSESETEDLTQESVVAVMEYLKRRGSFSGNLITFTSTVARNRCRNHLVWQKRHHKLPLEPLEPYIASDGTNPLDQILGNEVLELIQLALDRLGAPCRDLLRSLYLEGVTIERIREREGLKSVQSIYYRRAQCLKKAGQFLRKRLRSCSSSGEER